MSPDFDSFYEALRISSVAVPFLFGILALFVFLIQIVGGIKDRHE